MPKDGPIYNNKIKKRDNMDETKCSREKWWSELTDGEKIERMRSIIVQQKNAIENLAADNRRLKKHSHNTYTGDIVISISHSDMYESERPRRRQGENKDDVYI